MEILFAILIGYCIFAILYHLMAIIGYIITALIFITGAILAVITIIGHVCWRIIRLIIIFIRPKLKAYTSHQSNHQIKPNAITTKTIKQYNTQEKIEFAVGLLATFSLLILIWAVFTTSIATDILIAVWIIFNAIVACIGAKLLNKFKNQ